MSLSTFFKLSLDLTNDTNCNQMSQNCNKQHKRGAQRKKNKFTLLSN